MPDPMPDPTPDAPKRPRLRVGLLLAATLAGTFAAAFFGVRAPQPAPAPPPPAVAPDGDAPPPAVAMGWVDDADAVRAVEAAMPRPLFAQTPAGAGDPPPKSVFLWHAHKRLTGANPPAMNQNPVGSCVSFGTSRAFERSLAVQIVRGERFDFRHLAEEVIYAGSRVEVGGGRIRGDGSVGAWAAQFVTRWGGLPRGTYSAGGLTYDITRYDPARCRSWGQSGVPDALEAEAKRFPAGDAAKVVSWSEAKLALSQGYGIAVCSNQGFSFQRDARGVCRASGSWAHCMCIDGYHTDEQGNEWGHIENSWGPNAHTGPVGWGEPSAAGFWAAAGTIHGMLRQGDSWAFSAVKGFPKAPPLDWFDLAARPRRPFRGAAEAFALAP